MSSVRPRVDPYMRGKYNRNQTNSERVRLKVANQTGKRYVCAKCSSEFIVTKAGNGTVTCCNEPMSLK